MHDRHDLTDEQWALLEPLLPDRRPRRCQWIDHRRVVNGVMWRTRTGSPWRDLPACHGHWKTFYNRHRRWSGDGTWAVLDGLRVGADGLEPEWTVGVDSTVVRAHQHAAGARAAAPMDIPAQRLVSVLDGPAVGSAPVTGGLLE